MTSRVAPDSGTIGLQVGCQFDLRSSNPTTAVLQVAPHGDQTATITGESWDGAIPHRRYADEFDNRCERFALPAGELRLAYSAEVSVSALADEQAWDARETPIDELPDELLRWVMPSRFCQPDELGSDAWRMFGPVAARVGTGPGDRRLRQRPPRVRARLIEPLDHGRRRLPVRTGRLPRLRAPGHHVLPSAQHPRPLRVRLHPRHRHPSPTSRWTSAPGSRSTCGPLVHLRRPHQPTSHRPCARRTRTRRGRRGADDVVRRRRLLGFVVKADRLV